MNIRNGFPPRPPVPTPVPTPVPVRLKMSLYSDNARVFYKPHSLSGIGGVRNYRKKQRKT